MSDPLDANEAKRRLAEMRGSLGGRYTSGTGTEPTEVSTPSAVEPAATEERATSQPADLLDDPAAMAAAMERAAYREHLEQELRRRDERIEALEAELARHREILSRMSGLLAEALSPTPKVENPAPSAESEAADRPEYSGTETPGSI